MPSSSAHQTRLPATAARCSTTCCRAPHAGLPPRLQQLSKLQRAGRQGGRRPVVLGLHLTLWHILAACWSS